MLRIAILRLRIAIFFTGPIVSLILWSGAHGLSVSFNAEQWVVQSYLTASDGDADDFFGTSVDIDGDTAIVGSPNDDGKTGSAYIFERNASSWTQVAKLTAVGGAPLDEFGYSVSIRGNTVMVGARRYSVGRGAVYVFTRSAGVWSQGPRLTAADGTANDQFGVSLDLDETGNALIVGAYFDSVGGSQSGFAYTFPRSGALWNQTAKIAASDSSVGARFGQSVSISGTTLIVGAPNAEATCGAAYIFKQSGSAWIQDQKLAKPVCGFQDFYGTSVSISGNTALVGVINDAVKGAAYVYSQNSGPWVMQQRLSAADGIDRASFGGSVSLDGDTAVIGGSADDDLGNASGSVYLFSRTGGIWSLQQKLTATAGLAGDAFGNSVAVDLPSIIVGSLRDDELATDQGSASVLSPEPIPIATPTPTPNPSPTPSPTPAAVQIVGRVVTPNGIGIRNTVVSLIDPQNVRRTAVTSSFGVYAFDNVVPGGTYTITALSKRYRFSPLVIQISVSMSNVDIIGLE